MPLQNLFTDLLDDIRDPGIMWQVGAIVVAAALGWLLARFIRKSYLSGRAGTEGVTAIGVASFAHVLSPLLIASLLWGATYLLQRYHLNVHVLRIAMPVFASLAVIRAAFYLMRRVFARHGAVGSAILTFEKIFATVVWLAVAMYITGLWPDIFGYLNTTTLPLGRHNVTLLAIGQAVVSVVVLLMLALWAGAALEERLMGMQTLHTSLRVVMARMSRAVLILVAVLVSLSLVGIDLTVLSVFGGALGVGLGLGLQKIASNYVSGFVILLERSLSIGDIISVDKFSGKVTHINTRYTVLQGLDGVETVLPNEMLISGPVQNQSLSTSRVRLGTQLTVSYNSDLDLLFPQLEEAASTVTRVLQDPPPNAVLRQFGPDGFDLDVGFWIDDPHNGRGGVVSDVNRALWKALRTAGVTLPHKFYDVRLQDLRTPPATEELSQPNTN
ncbi:MAG: mechanosensitive ion channel domain-containing protein [Massilia sp.]